MIQKISLKNVASYKDEAVLETDKRINLIYGLNGAGKTQITKYLADRDNDKFKECSIQGLSDEKILVYNQDFIDTNFYQLHTQKGIFTLSKENTEARKEIEDLQKKLENLKENLENEKKKLQDQKDKINEENTAFENKIWESVIKKYKDNFKDFFKGIMGSKERFREFILSQFSSKEKQIQGIATKDIKTIEKEFKILNDDNQASLDEIKIIDYDNFIKIENDSIFEEIVIGNKDSVVSNLIESLGNGDWVKQGFDQYLSQDTICPFCQQKTITLEFREHLKLFFDKTYQEKIEKLQNIQKQCESFLSYLPNKDLFYRGEILNDKDLRFEKLYNQVRLNIKQNLEKIKEKIKEPSQKIELKSSESLLDELNKYIKDKQNEVEEFNKLLNNKGEEKKKLEEEFWKNVLLENLQSIQAHKAFIQNNKQESIEKAIESLQGKISNQEGQIQQKQKETLNIQEAVDKINQYLRNLGIVSFSIRVKDAEEKTYVIVREGESEPSFKTLSEGEKTLISFLYFLQYCQGKGKQDDVSFKKIIVIDDPISSLSFNYVFDIAQLIKAKFFRKNDNNEYEQIFILTHHLYFFKELSIYEDEKDIKKETKKINRFRITRDKNFKSCIYTMEKDEILNDYQAYWQILKEYQEDKVNAILVPNVMRNILEYFRVFYRLYPKRQNRYDSKNKK